MVRERDRKGSRERSRWFAREIAMVRVRDREEIAREIAREIAEIRERPETRRIVLIRDRGDSFVRDPRRREET